MKLVDITGQRFGRLVVIKRNGYIGDRVAWLCQCDCGNTKTTTAQALKRGYVSSCGCYRKEIATKVHTKHGLCGTSLYGVLSNMKKRCYNPKSDHYKWYGGKGITICDEWMGEDGYENFMKWALENGYKEGLTIDRIDNEKGYCPENCRWVTNKEQSNNRTNNHYITIDGDTKTLQEWGELYGISPYAISTRINRLKWNEEKAVKTPLLRERRNK